MTGTPAAWICSDIHIYIYDPLLTEKPKIRSEDTGMNVRELKQRLMLKEKALVRNFESFDLKRHGHKFYGNISNMKTLLHSWKAMDLRLLMVKRNKNMFVILQSVRFFGAPPRQTRALILTVQCALGVSRMT